MKKLSLIGLVIFLFAGVSQAEWSWNIATENPPASALGVNFEYFWTNFALELGVGSFNSSNSKNSNKSASLGGDVNLKYLFESGWFRPFVEGGVMVGTAANTGSVTASAGTGFLGGGAMLMGQKFYFYLGGILISSSAVFEAGLGFFF